MKGSNDGALVGRAFCLLGHGLDYVRTYASGEDLTGGLPLMRDYDVPSLPVHDSLNCPCLQVYRREGDTG